MLGYSQRADGDAAKSQDGRKAQEEFRKELDATPLGRRAQEARTAAVRQSRRRGSVRRPTARPATAAAHRASPAIPTSTTTTGSGAARSTISTRPSASASARRSQGHRAGRCRGSVSTSCWTTAQINDAAEYRAVAVGQVEPMRRPAGRGGDLCRACAACHGEKGKGNQELGAPNLTDAIWLYGNAQGRCRDVDLDRPRRHDAGVGRAARRRDHQGARGLRAHLGGGK